MKELRASLLLLLVATLTAVALLKLNRGEPLTIPVRMVELNATRQVQATPIIPPERDVKEKDPLGLFAKTVFALPHDDSGWALYKGKLYPVQKGRVTLPGRHDAPITLTLIVPDRLCAIPKGAAIRDKEEWYILDANGTKREVAVKKIQKDLLLTSPPCPRQIRIAP